MRVDPLEPAVRAAAALALLLLPACNGSGTPGVPTAAVPPPAAAPAAVPAGAMESGARLAEIYAGQGNVNGADNLFKPHDGDTKTGAQGQTVDNITCKPVMDTTHYHVHVFLGFYVNGREVAMPDGVGMYQPGKPDSGGYIDRATCYYDIHTHGASGIVHIESPQVQKLSKVVYHLRDLLDLWGQVHTPTQFGPFTGPMHVFVANADYLGQAVVKGYTAYHGDIADIPLRSHEVIWIEIGTPYYGPKKLPAIDFYTEY